MIELTVINFVNVIAVILMVFFAGLSIERTERTKEVSGVLHKIFLVITMICVFVR